MVNLYPFYEKVTSSQGINFEDGIENIDIGGPAMIRAAAKVGKWRTVWVNYCQSCLGICISFFPISYGSRIETRDLLLICQMVLGFSYKYGSEINELAQSHFGLVASECVKKSRGISRNEFKSMVTIHLK